jgi:hypothetical protein
MTEGESRGKRVGDWRCGTGIGGTQVVHRSEVAREGPLMRGDVAASLEECWRSRDLVKSRARGACGM